MRLGRLVRRHARRGLSALLAALVVTTALPAMPAHAAPRTDGGASSNSAPVRPDVPPQPIPPVAPKATAAPLPVPPTSGVMLPDGVTVPDLPALPGMPKTVSTRPYPDVVPPGTRDLLRSLAPKRGVDGAVATPGAGDPWGDDWNGQIGDGRTTYSAQPTAITSLATGVTSIAAGQYHALAIQGGLVYAWGANAQNQLGDGTTTLRSSPVQVPGISSITAVAAGGYHSLAVTSSGTVYAWGRNVEGQLGDGTTNAHATPVQVPGFTNIVAVAAGVAHSMARASDGSVYVWGRNTEGEVGNGTTTNQLAPVKLTGVVASQISAGGWHSVALRTDGTVAAWGWNGAGQLGDNTTINRLSPIAVLGVGGTGTLSGVTAVAAGVDHTVALMSNQTLTAWGLNFTGQLGDGTQTDRHAPVAVSTITTVGGISAGWRHTTARTDPASPSFPGFVYDWGWNTTGELGDTTRDLHTTADQVVDTTGTGGISGVTLTASGYYFTLALKNGAVYSWGDNFYGTLGLGATSDHSTPSSIAGLTNVVATASGAYHSLALKADGSVWAWGMNSAGQLGDGTTTQRTAPVQVSGLSGVIAVAAGMSHSYALKNDGTIWSWGNNDQGQLGDGTTTARLTPVAVTGLQGKVIAIASGWYHGAALYANGAVIAWGYNAHGELGDGNTLNSATPQWVATSSAFSTNAQARGIGAGAYHTFIVTKDNALVSFGWNSYGQLGDGTTTSQSAPVAVSGLTTNITMAAGGFGHSVAVKNDGTVWTWGNDANGQLGDGTTNNRLTAAQIPSLTGVQLVTAGQDHVVAVTNANQAYGWGFDFLGQVGNGTQTMSQTTPVAVAGGAAQTAVSGGVYHTTAVATLPVQGAPAGTDKNAPMVNGATAGISTLTSTGNFKWTAADVAIAGLGPTPMFARTYNSNDTRAGSLGTGWSTSYGIHLSSAGDGTGAVILDGPQGRSDRYVPAGGGTFTPPTGLYTTLVERPDGIYVATLKDQSQWWFDGQGHLIRVQDQFGNFSNLTYDANVRLTTVSDPAKRGNLALGYDASGRLSTLTDWQTPTARTVNYTYDANGRLSQVRDRTGQTTTYGYDANGRLATVTDANGHTIVTNTYDASGRIATQKDAAGLGSGQQYSFSYTTNADGTTTTTVSLPQAAYPGAYTATVADTFESHGWQTKRVAQPTSTETVTTRFGYDTNGDLTSVIDPRGNTTTYCYDILYAGLANGHKGGNLNRIIAPAPSGTATPLVTMFLFDNNNNLVESVAPGGVTTTSAVSCSTDLSAAFQTQWVTDYYFDAANQMYATVRNWLDPDTNALVQATTKLQYGDAANPGRLTAAIPPRGNTTSTPDMSYATTYTYNASGGQAGLLASASDPLGDKRTYSYDAVGRKTAVVDENGNAPGATGDHTWTWTYDNEDRVLTSNKPAPSGTGAKLQTQTQYDAVGDPTVSIDANGQVTKYLYDVRNLLSEVDASPASWTEPTITPSPLYRTTYTYDALGRTTRVTRAAGDTANERATDVASDALGRERTETQYPSWPATTPTLVTTKTYDANSNLATLADPNGHTTSFSYDPLNRLSGITYNDGSTPNVSYGYNGNGVRTSMSDGTGTTTYTVDTQGRLTQLAVPGSSPASFRYDLDGGRTKVSYPNGAAVSYTIDKAQHVSALGDGVNTQSFTYNPDATLKGTTEVNGISGTYAYDNAARLTQVQHASGPTNVSTQTYSIDPLGNRTQVVDQIGTASTTTSYGYDRLARLTQEAVTGGATTSYAYDPAGNRTSKTVGTTTASYGYDRADRITSAGGVPYTVDGNGNLTARGSDRFSYDQADRLASAAVGATTASYRYNGDGLRATKTVGAATTSYVYDMGSATPRLLTDGTYDYVWGPGGLAYLMDATKVAKSYATDGLGSVRALTDGTRTATDTATRDAFGNLIQSTGSTAQPFGFTGEVRDGETGFLYLTSRSYDPATGRFLTRDSLPSGNRYVYANDNPVRFTDPSGHLAESGDVTDGGACVDAACGTYVPYSETTTDAAQSSSYLHRGDRSHLDLHRTPFLVGDHADKHRRERPAVT